jgi:hypothetical protein
VTAPVYFADCGQQVQRFGVGGAWKIAEVGTPDFLQLQAGALK